MRRILKEIALAAWLPTTAGAITFATSWLVWFLTEPGCVPSATVTCPKLPWGMYITPEVLRNCYIHTFLAISVTGGSDIMLFIREFRNREKDRERHEQQRAEDRERYDEQQKINAQQRAEDRERHERVMTFTENMMQQTLDRAVEAQARADADRRAYIESQARLADAIAGRNPRRRSRRRPRRRSLRSNAR